MEYLALIRWPGLTLHDLWRWLMIAMGLIFVAKGLLSKHMRMRDHDHGWSGFWRGKIVKNPRGILYFRALYILIGAGMVAFGFDPNYPGKP